jgi:hypothetical protein
VDAIPNIDMDRMYELIVNECRKDAEEMSLMFLGPDAVNPVAQRISLGYVCPGRVHVVDDALTKVQQSSHDADVACSLPPNLRTQKQQDLAEVLSCA